MSHNGAPAPRGRIPHVTVRLSCFFAVVPLLLAAGDRPRVIEVDARSLQRAVDAAPPHATLIADRNDQVEISATVRIDKPLTLVGLNARLEPGLGKTPILEVVSEGVRIRDFLLTGNGDSVEQADRAPLILLRRGRFLVENGETNNSAKDGVMITPVPEYGDIEHGVIRNLTGRDTIRDIVSISGAGDLGLFVRHLVVENIRAYGSRLRGAVEVSDGSEHITVRDVYAESSFYGADVQDHGREGMVNRHVVIDGVQVVDCVTAIRTANHDFGHDGLVIRNVSGSGFRPSERWRPLHVKNTRNLVIENVSLEGVDDGPTVLIENSDEVALRNVTIRGAGGGGPAVAVEDADRALIDNVAIVGARQPGVGVAYRVRANEVLGGLRIRDVLAERVDKAGILVENLSETGRLRSYSITGNLATVQAPSIEGPSTLRDNLQ